MDQIRDFADDRLGGPCVYCGGPPETRDHVPSRVFLDSPLPENLPVVPSCSECNADFSKDEEYVACLIEVVIAGSVDPARIRRNRIAKTLRARPALRQRLEAAKSDTGDAFAIAHNRIRTVLLKLARGHAAFELSQIRRTEPSSFWFVPLQTLSQEQRDDFDSPHVVHLFGEVGSRSSQRFMAVTLKLASADGTIREHGVVINDWVDVQEGRYRYLASDDVDGIDIKLVIGDYLACEVRWD